MNKDTTEEIGEEVGLLILESKLNILLESKWNIINVYSIDLNYFSIVLSEIKNSRLTKVWVSKTSHYEQLALGRARTLDLMIHGSEL